MGLRTLALAGILLAVTAVGFAQVYEPNEKMFFTVSGDVKLEDGSPPPDSVLVQRVCNGRTTFGAWTDSKGHFDFRVGGNDGNSASADATQAGPQPSDMNKAIGTSTQYSYPITTALRNCEVQAILPGFKADGILLALKSIMDDGRVGTFILHPTSRASSFTVSSTTLRAPAAARRAYEKGLDAERLQHWDIAVEEFTKAVKMYAQFAAAWYELGRTRQARNDLAGAGEAWTQALKADPKYEKPYETMTALADHKQDWAASEKYSSAWLQLDAEDFPGAYLFNAIANARLNHMDVAEHAAREGLRVDKNHRIPRLSYVLGLILMQRNDIADAIPCFKAYLELAPDARDAGVVKDQVAKLEAAAVVKAPGQ